MWLRIALILGLAACEVAELHEPCGEAVVCEGEARCTAWFDIAGEERKTCEIPCAPDESCPDDLECHSYMDGPQDICERGEL